MPQAPLRDSLAGSAEHCRDEHGERHKRLDRLEQLWTVAALFPAGQDQRRCLPVPPRRHRATSRFRRGYSQARSICAAGPPSGKRAESKTPMADYDDGCRVKSISTKCPTKKSRTSSSPPISRRENASVSRRHSRRSSESLAKTCKSGSHKPVARMPFDLGDDPARLRPASGLIGEIGVISPFGGRPTGRASR